MGVRLSAFTVPQSRFGSFPASQSSCLIGSAFVAQDLFLGVDGLSPTQWHPYSTVGGPRPHTLVAHIKSYGRWTSGLIRRLLRDGSVVMRIDGPYGEEEERPEWTRFRTVVIIAGGIGVRYELTSPSCSSCSPFSCSECFDR